MFVFGIKFKSYKKVIAVAACGVLVLLAVVVFKAQGETLQDNATCDELGSYSLVADTKADEISFLNQLGLKPIADSRQSESIVIPAQFNKAYEDYNILQKKAGLDLYAYKGENAEKITYSLENPYDECNLVVIIVCRDRVIGGHRTNGEFGFENKPLV